MRALIGLIFLLYPTMPWGQAKDPLKVEVSTDLPRYAVGDTLRLKYRAANQSGRDLPLSDGLRGILPSFR